MTGIQRWSEFLRRSCGALPELWRSSSGAIGSGQRERMSPLYRRLLLKIREIAKPLVRQARLSWLATLCEAGANQFFFNCACLLGLRGPKRVPSTLVTGRWGASLRERAEQPSTSVSGRRGASPKVLCGRQRPPRAGVLPAACSDRPRRSKSMMI